MSQPRSAGGHAMAAARVLSGAARHAAFAAGQAAAVAHVAAHELGAAAYAIKAARAAAPAGETKSAGELECRWQRQQLPDAIRELVLDDQRLRNSDFEQIDYLLVATPLKHRFCGMRRAPRHLRPEPAHQRERGRRCGEGVRDGYELDERCLGSRRGLGRVRRLSRAARSCRVGRTDTSDATSAGDQAAGGEKDSTRRPSSTARMKSGSP
jgi:hypothetical protein